MQNDKTTYIDDFFVINEIDEVNRIEIEPEWIENGYRSRRFMCEWEY